MKHPIILLVLLTLAACRPPEEGGVAPALLANPGVESRQEIEQIIATVLGSGRVTLAEDVFTTSSVLVLERGLQRGVERLPELGRDLGRPYRVQLVTDGTQCFLVDLQDGDRWLLNMVECTEE